jgi:hypothetical protein
LPRSFVSYQTHDLFQNQYTYVQDFGDENKEHHLNISAFTEYMQNFGQKCGSCKNLGSMPFWSGTNQMTIGNNDGKADIDAYQLGLGNVVTNADGIAGIIQLNPTIQHVGTDMSLYYVHSKQDRGFYFRAHAPLGAMIVTPNFKELMVAQSNNSVSFSQTTADGGILNPSSDITYEFKAYPVPLDRIQSVSQYFFGGVLGNSLDGYEDKVIHIRKGRIAPCKEVTIRLGDITASVGYNAYMSEKGFFGLGVKASMPTGNVPNAVYMLQPIFGRAGAWGLGGEICGSYRVWENHDQTRNLSVAVQGEVLHLFPGRTPNYRSFDLAANGPGSKYLLVQHYAPAYSSGSSTTPQNDTQIMLANRLHPAINITTLPVISNIAVEGSLAMAIDYHCENWNAALGGEFWGRSREKLQIDIAGAVDQGRPNLNDYAVVGRQVSRYSINGELVVKTLAYSNPIDTFYCEPLAKINKSRDPVQLIGAIPLAQSGTAGTGVIAPSYADLPDGIKDGRLSENRIPENVCEALNIAGAQASRAFTGKVFGQAGYTWTQHCHMPSLAVIGSAEFTGKTNNAIQLWSVGLQGSLNF